MVKLLVRQGRRYRVVISLGLLERIVSNAMIAQKFAEFGFIDVKVSGQGPERVVEGIWPLPDSEGEVPRQVVEILEI